MQRESVRLLQERHSRLRAEVEQALAAGQAPWRAISLTAWRLLRDCSAELGLASGTSRQSRRQLRRIRSARDLDELRERTDLILATLTLAVGKIALNVALALENWTEALAVGMEIGTAVDLTVLVATNPAGRGAKAAVTLDLFRMAERLGYAAHRAGVPTETSPLVEKLTSVHLADRTAMRSAQQATGASLLTAARVLRAIRKRDGKGSWSFRLPTDPELADFPVISERSMRESFAEVDNDRHGARTVIASGRPLAMEAMRLSGRDLVYLCAGELGGCAVRYRHDALYREDVPLAESVELPGFTVTAVGEWAEALRAVLGRWIDEGVSGREADRHVGDLLTRVGLEVWGPLLARWPGLRDRPIAVVPVGEANALPLYTATVDDRPACAVLDLTLVPSARSLVLACEYAPHAGGVLVVADPGSPGVAIPHVVHEAAAVAEVHGVEAVVTGDDRTTARVEALVSEMRRSSVVHLACHGVVDHTDPGKSTLSVGGGIPLSSVLAEDLLPGCLVVLSGCDLAGTWALLPGERFGFPAFLLASGARSVVAAMWPVLDSDRTARLMTELHRGLADHRSSVALGAAVDRARVAGAPALLWATFSHFGA